MRNTGNWLVRTLSKTRKGNIAKKAQLSAIIIMAVLLFLVIALYSTILKPKATGERAGELALAQIPAKAQPVKVFIDRCIEQTMTHGIEMLGLQGGYLYLPDQTLKTQYATVAYWYDGALRIPSTLDMESQLKQYAEETVPQCLQNLTAFKPQWNSIQTGALSTRVTVANETVLVKVGYPVTLTDAQGSYTLGNFTLAVPVRLGYLHDVLERSVQQFSAQQPWVDLTALSQAKTDANIIPIDQGHFLLSMTDNTTIVKDRTFQLFAAVMFVPDNPPKIIVEDAYHLTEEQEFSAQLTAADEDPASVTFSDDTVLFDITPQGLIKFSPHIPGTYDMQITATDKQGKTDRKQVTFIVEAKH